MASDASNPTQNVIVVGIIGSTNHAYSKNWVCKQLISNQITNSINDDEKTLYDPFEWIRQFQSATNKDKCTQKVNCLIYLKINPCTQLKMNFNIDQ